MAKRDKFQGRVEDGVDRPCNWPGCKNAGAFRAPFPRNMADDLAGNKDDNGDDGELRRLLEGGLDDRVDGSAWFCLQHVREYNAEWDFFDGMNEDEINDFRDADASWHRPTWPASATVAGAGMDSELRAGGPWTGAGGSSDPHGLFPGAGGKRTQGKRAEGNGAAAGFKRALSMRELEALRVLGLEEDASVTDIKTSFKRLAKQHHPDLNNGDADSGDRLRAVIEAYNCLSGAFQDC